MTSDPYDYRGSAPAFPSTQTGTSDRVQTAKEEASEVAGTAKQGAADVARETVQQAKAVTGVAKDHARSLVDGTTTQLRTHAEDQAQRAATGLEQVVTKVQALLAGRPEEAGEVGDVAQELGDRAQQLADRLRTGGVDGVLSDAGRFARRRPGLFLAAAATAGFFAGRLVKAQRGDNTGNGQAPTFGVAPSTYEAYDAYPQAGYRSTPGAAPALPDATTPPAVDAIPSVGAGPVYGTSRASTERETW